MCPSLSNHHPLAKPRVELNAHPRAPIENVSRRYICLWMCIYILGRYPRAPATPCQDLPSSKILILSTCIYLLPCRCPLACMWLCLIRETMHDLCIATLKRIKGRQKRYASLGLPRASALPFTARVKKKKPPLPTRASALPIPSHITRSRARPPPASARSFFLCLPPRRAPCIGPAATSSGLCPRPAAAPIERVEPVCAIPMSPPSPSPPPSRSSPPLSLPRSPPSNPPRDIREGGEDGLKLLRTPSVLRECPHEIHRPTSCEGDVVWTSLGTLPRWVPGPTTRWAPGTTRLALHGTC
jgi:hypothetical protein